MGCPFAAGDKRLDVGNQYQPFEQDGMREFFQMAAVDTPVVYNEQMGYYIVTRRRDIMAIMRDMKRFSASIALEPITPIFESVAERLKNSRFCPVPVQVNSDRPVHPRIRQLVSPIFNRKGVAKIEPDIQRIVKRFVDNIRGKGTIDMIEDFAYELPAMVICHMLGIDEQDVPNVKKWANDRLEFVFGDLTEERQNATTDNLIEYWEFCEDLVADRIKNPRDDYASYLLEKRNGDDAILTLQEIVSLQYGLLLAGHETTTNMTANAVYTLMQNRDAWHAICNDHSLIPNAVEECLRLNGSVVCWRRLALEDMEFSGTKIPKGSKVLLALAGGNLDPDEFENPTKFDIYRKNAKRHVTFGHGPHVCIGQDIAREELRIILQQLATAFPNMTLANQDPLDYIRTITFRGPKTLMVHLNEV